ncbi:uncharacterized protein LOC111447242 [Cucurbita moschata]|uniref:Uncharacterized protein LOC111447242 n=1 Tax=Cucurbita moschata TaxID=3662 RepID=A0A6J1FQ78_CUCMO|nr:uncharacterized protein LOC111447242 [Cucurbita moschata]
MEEGSGSNDHIDHPKAFFIFHNIRHVLPDYWAIPPMNDNPVEHLDSTYRHVVDVIFTSLLNFLGRLGGLYINLRGQGYLQIYSPRAFWDVDSFREMLREVLSDQHRVPQENDAIIWHNTNLQSLFSLIPQERRVIGCLLEDQYGNKQEIKIHDFLRFLVHPNENLVFVVGDFRNYRVLEEEIDQYVKVSDPGTPMNLCVRFICQECQRRWNLI